MLYFAYGSNMCLNRLKNRVPSSTFYTVARLSGYTLKFHKKSKDGSGKCNAFQTNNSEDLVIGVVFNIKEDEKSDLDKAEGLGSGYEQVDVTLESDIGNLNAYMYRAVQDAIDDDLEPYSWYKLFVVTGARQHNLPLEYIRQIELVPDQKDSDKDREKRELKKLPC